MAPNRLLTRKSCLFIILGLALVAVVAIGTYAFFTLRRPLPSRPRVVLVSALGQGELIAGQTQIMRATASDPEGIDRVEFWVNGGLIGTQLNTENGETNSFSASQAWRPDAPGLYTLQAQAYDTQGYVGQSELIVLQAEAWVSDDDPAATTQVILGEGETLEALALALGVDPEELMEGDDGMAAPFGFDEEEGESDDEDSEVPTVPPASPETGAPSEPSSEPLPFSPPTWRDSTALPHLWGRLGGSEPGTACRLFPLLCVVPILGGSPPLPPSEVRAEVDPATGCEVRVSWRDNAEDEVGYEIYRLSLSDDDSSGTIPTDLIALVGPVPGSGDLASITDHLPPSLGPRDYAYMVNAYNSGGEVVSSSPSNTVSSACLPEELRGTQAIAVEALEMHISESLDVYQVYCYVSLAEAPFERIPPPPSIIVYEDDAWNIARYFSGGNRRSLIARTDQPLTVEAECLGYRRGSGVEAELVRLGSFIRSHPSSEWDGRLLYAGPDDGAFQVIYRISPVIATDTPSWPVIDPSLPAPYGLYTDDYWVDCDAGCSPMDEPGLHWSWDGGALGDTAIRGFNIYQRLEGESRYRIIGSAPLPGFSAALGPCVSRSYYAVSAVSSAVDPATGELRHSPLSAELEVERHCEYALEIELLGLNAIQVRDGFRGRRNTVQAYGEIRVNRVVVKWNAHCDGSFRHGCIGTGPNTTTLRNGVDYPDLWRNAYLNQFTYLITGYRTGNNIVRIAATPGLEVRIGFTFYDHDRASRDDVFCASESDELVLVLDDIESLVLSEAGGTSFSVSGSHSRSRCSIYGLIRVVPAGPFELERTYPSGSDPAEER